MNEITVSDWVLISTTVALAITAFLTPLIGEKIRHWWLGLVLRIGYEPHPPGTHRTRLDVRLSSSQVEKRAAYYFRLIVTNDGHTQARRCEMVLEELWRANAAGGLERLPQFGPIGLLWGSGYQDFVDINPSRVFFCDFLTIPDAEAQSTFDMFGEYIDFAEQAATPLGLVLCTRAAFYSQPNRLPAGAYRMRLALFSENADPVRVSAEVDWSGQWQNTDTAMIEECKARLFEAGAI